MTEWDTLQKQREEKLGSEIHNPNPLGILFMAITAENLRKKVIAMRKSRKKADEAAANWILYIPYKARCAMVNKMKLKKSMKEKLEFHFSLAGYVGGYNYTSTN